MPPAFGELRLTPTKKHRIDDRSMAKLADLIWKNAELLRGAFKENEYRKVILPFTILRRLDCVLAPSREAVLKKYEAVKKGGYDLDKMLTPTSGYETKLNNAVVDALDGHTAMADQALRHPKVFKGLAELLVDEVYRQLRDKSDSQPTA